MRPIITVTAVVLVHLCVIAVLVGVNGCRSTSGFEQPGDTAAFSGGARPVAAVPAVAPIPAPAAVPSDRLPTPAPTKLAANGPVGPGGKRTVVKGETLFSVAKNENTTIAALAKANGLTLNAMLKPGQVLTIPSASAAAPKSGATKSGATKSAAPKAAPAPAPSFAPLKLVPLTGSAPAPAAAPAPAPDKK